jgi:hypothetical protein
MLRTRSSATATAFARPTDSQCLSCMRRVRGAAAAFAVLLVSLAGSSTAPSATEGPLARPTPARPCGAHPRPAVYRHVLWIVMENKAYGDVIGSPVAPYENQLARRCGLATSYYVVAHPSLPNYIAHTSGETHGINDNDPPAAHTLAGAIIASRLYRAGKMALFLVWDEDDDNHANHIPAVVVAPAVRPGTLATGRLDHYSLLRTTEELLGLRQFLGNAAGAPSMRRAFGL